MSVEPPSFNQTVNYTHTKKILNLEDLFKKIKLDKKFVYKAYWNTKTGFNETVPKMPGGSKKPMKNMLTLSWYSPKTTTTPETTVPVKITETGKITMAMAPLIFFNVIADDVVKKINETHAFVKKNFATTVINDWIKIRDVDLVNLEALDKHLIKLNLTDYKFIKSSPQQILFKYFRDGIKFTVAIYGRGKIRNIISIEDKQRHKDVPQEARGWVSNYVLDLITPLLTKNSDLNLLVPCGSGKILRREKGKVKCFTPKSKDIITYLFKGTKDYKGFQQFGFSALKECIEFINQPNSSAGVVVKQKTQKLLDGRVPGVQLHNPLLESDFPRIKAGKWLLFGIPSGYKRMRLYVDTLGVSYYIDMNDNLTKTSLPLDRNYHDTVLDGYYHSKNDFYSPIDILAYRGFDVTNKVWKEREVWRKEVAKSFNLFSKFVTLDKFTDLKINTLSGLVFKFTGKDSFYYTYPSFSWNEIDTAIGEVHTGYLAIGSTSLRGYNYRDGTQLELQIAKGHVVNVRVIRPKIPYDPAFSERTYHSLVRVTDIFKILKG